MRLAAALALVVLVGCGDDPRTKRWKGLVGRTVFVDSSGYAHIREDCTRIPKPSPPQPPRQVGELVYKPRAYNQSPPEKMVVVGVERTKSAAGLFASPSICSTCIE